MLPRSVLGRKRLMLNEIPFSSFSTFPPFFTIEALKKGKSAPTESSETPQSIPSSGELVSSISSLSVNVQGLMKKIKNCVRFLVVSTPPPQFICRVIILLGFHQ